MSLTNFQNNRVVHRNDTSSIQLANDNNTLTKSTNDKLDSQITQQTAVNTKLDQLSGAINNNIGDGSVKLQTYIYGHDSGNGLARPLAVTSNGELKVSNDVLEVSAETVNLNTDTLEAKIQATNDKLDSFSGAGNNNIGEGSTKLQTYLYGRDVSAGNFKPLVCDSDAHLQVDVLSTALPTGGATESTLSALEIHGGNIETSVQLMDDVVTVQNASHPNKANAVGGRYYVDNTFRDIRVDDIGKVIVDSPAGSDINTRLDNINTNVTTLNGKITQGADATVSNATQILAYGRDQSGNLDALNVDNNGHLKITLNDIESDITNSIAVGIKGRTDITDSATAKFLLCDSSGRLSVINRTGIVNHSEASYVSGQSISGSGTHTGASISVDANTKAFYVEHNFSNTAIKYEILASIDNSNFFSTGVEFNAGGMTPATLTGISTILGTSSSASGFPPFIKFKFTNSDSSVQSATLSYVQQIS